MGLAGSLFGRSLFAQLRYGQRFTSIAKTDPTGVDPKSRGVSVVFGFGF